MSAPKFPRVQSGGSLILAWQIRNRPVLVIGGGEVAAGRILNCLNADAKVTCVCPAQGLNPEVQHRIDKQQITHIDRNFLVSDLDTSPPPSLVLCAVDDPIASTQVYKECQQRRIAANIADVPPECDFYFGSVHRDGPLQIMVSTNGNGPRMAAIVRRFIAKALPRNTGQAIVKVGVLRRKLRKVVPAIEDGPQRMKWYVAFLHRNRKQDLDDRLIHYRMSDVCEGWSLEDLCEMTEEDMERLITFYESGQVPSLGALRSPDYGGTVGFDGSFGWYI